MTMLHNNKLIMLQFPSNSNSIHLLSSSPLLISKLLFTQSSQLWTKYSTCSNKPLLFGYLNSNPTKDRSKKVNEIAKDVVHLQCESSAKGGVCHVYLVGTCHVSQKSCEEVKAVINYIKPQAMQIVFLELCKDRLSIVTRSKAQITSQREWNEINFWKMMKFRYQIICNSDFWKRLKDEIAKLPKDIHPRDVRKYLLQKKQKEWEDGDVYAYDAKIRAMRREAFPSLWEIRVVERDKYMSQRLWDLATEHTSIVAVVGRAHLPGIKKYWMQPIELESLLEVPPRKEYFIISKIHASIRAITDLIAVIFYQPKK